VRPRPEERILRPAEPAGPPPVGIRLAAIDEVELRIEKLVAGGDGLARYEGVPVFVPRSAPGDRVRARLTERRPDYGRAEVIEVLDPGPGRREPPCPHFSECGGCDLQHLDERTQLEWKARATLETLAKLSKLALPPPREIVAGTAWGYRLRTSVHVEAGPDGAARVGYHARGSHRLVEVDRCPVLVPELERAVTTLGERLTAPLPPRVDLAAGDGGEIAAAPPAGGHAGGELVRRVAGHELQFDARGFFQGHAGLLDELVDRVVGPWTGETAFDLYAGVGLFALPLAGRYGRVTVVEGDRIAARLARKNARVARLESIDVVAQAVDTWIVEGLPPGVDRVVVDPPRAGLGRAVRAALVSRRPARVTYVSCHPAALARDLAELAYAFEVESLVLVDLFPQTGQMEVVVQLVARPGGAEE
jgi:tRNA/tmRNA/rRNA uracil-C5-methylase (TrmA/RlmC/RlmD family)